MKVAKNCVVSINFTLSSDQGERLDASEEGAPLVYLHGAAGIIPGLESELEGKDIGEGFSVTVSPADGFGESTPELIHKVPVDSFPDPDELQVGMQVQGTGADSGQVTNFTIREVHDDLVTLDANHPLAGMVLVFEGTVAGVREATDDEISQGHPAAA